MTLILKLDLDMVKMYLHTKNEVSMLRGSKTETQTDRHTDRQTDTQTHRHTDRQTDRQTDMTENITYPHTRVVITFYLFDLDIMTSVFKINPDFVKMYLDTENKIPNCSSLKHY